VTLRLKYFAWVRERVGVPEEEIVPPEDVGTVAELIEHLKSRGEGYAHAFERAEVIRVALDQRHAAPGQPLGSAREVAFFPPMTGG
jgi:sulfur-carrier protein